jgi:hypothetical protein
MPNPDGSGGALCRKRYVPGSTALGEGTCSGSAIALLTQPYRGCVALSAYRYLGPAETEESRPGEARP